MLESLKNVELVSNNLITNNNCEIIINNQYTFNIPLINACFFSNSISQQISNDLTQRIFSFNIDDFNLTDIQINKIYDFLTNGQIDFQDFDQANVLFKLASIFNSSLAKILLDEIEIYFNDLSIEDRLKFILMKYEIDLTNEEDIEFISSNFSKIIDEKSEIRDIFNNLKYFELLELILQNENLKI